ncbi:MAG: hypothetical protein K0R48_1035 [Gammaproteobacteria bacterium]|jgi:hypothetical protein|nr:hypothetical protein [Gammaproteobacteria bacterium]
MASDINDRDLPGINEMDTDTLNYRLGEEEILPDRDEDIDRFLDACGAANYSQVLFYIGHNNPLNISNKIITQSNHTEVWFSLICSLQFIKDIKGFEAIVARLVALGVDINTQDEDGNTVLHFVIDSYYELLTNLNQDRHNEAADMVKSLLEQGAHVNVINGAGATPLHRAAGACHAGIVGLLIQQGADIACGDKAGKTPFDIAREGALDFPQYEKGFLKIQIILLTETLKAIWILESAEFKSYLQWLPQEMVEDTGSLLFSTVTTTPSFFHSPPENTEDATRKRPREKDELNDDGAPRKRRDFGL